MSPFEKVTRAYLLGIITDARDASVLRRKAATAGTPRVGTYKTKKKVKTRDGEERVVYEYSPRQIQHRHWEKAKRLESLRSVMSDLLTKARKDLGSKDPKTKATALAVLLMDATYERVGNEDSAEEGHYGVSGWEVRHLDIGESSATITYVGKSGVSHKKTVKDKALVSALRGAVEGKKDSDCVIDVDAPAINDYLGEFDITSKDIRGFHANELMKERLERLRKDGPDLPRGRKEKDKVLKEEFNKALEEVAEEVGHEPSTLRGQYLVPALTDAFLHDGTVVDALDGDD